MPHSSLRLVVAPVAWTLTAQTARGLPLLRRAGFALSFLLIVVVDATGSLSLHAQSGATLFSFGTASGDTTMPRTDDGSVALSWAGTGPAGSTPLLRLYGSSYKSLFVNNNGNVSFNGPVSVYTPQGFSNANGFPPMIAPLWADADTRLNGAADQLLTSPGPRGGLLADPGSVYYRTTQDSTTLAAIGTKVRGSYLGTSSFVPTSAQIVTWDRVAGYGVNDSNATTGALRNTFQLVIASDGFESYAMFLYPTAGVQWLSGTVSPGSFPSVGFQDGAGNYFNAFGSGTSAATNLPNTSSAVPFSAGTQVYNISGSSIAASPVSQPALGVLASLVVTHRWVSANGSGNWAAGTTNWIGNSSFPAAIITDTSAAKWTDGDGAIFGGTAGTVSLTAPVSAQRITLETSGYTFTSTLAENSLQLAHLIMPSANSTVNFAGNLVVVVDRGLAATDLNNSGAYLGAITQGNLVFKDNSVLVGRGTGSIIGGTITLRSAAQFQLYGADPTSRGASLVFDRATEGGTGGKLDLRGYNTTVGTISSLGAGAGLITNSGTAAGTLTVDFDTAASTFSGTIQNGTGVLSLAKAGTGTLTLSGTNTYTGGTTVSGGLINFSSLANLGSGNLTLNGGGLQWATGSTTDVSSRLAALGSSGGTVDTNGNNVTFASILSGTGGLTKSGSGALTLSAANTYTGNTTINAGTLIAARNGQIGTFKAGTTVTVNSGGTLVATISDSLGWGSGNANLVINGGTVTTDTSTGQHTTLQNLTMTGGLLTSTATDGRFLLNGPLATMASSSTAVINAPYLDLLSGWTSGVTTSFTVAQGSTASGIDLSISSAVIGTGPVTKNGAGTLRLTGANTYTGATSVNAGTLLVNGSLANTAVSVANGGTLGGSGSIAGLTTVASGGHLAPGNSPGTLTFNSGLTLVAGSILDFELGSTSDLIRVSGGTLSGPLSGLVTLNLSNSSGFTAGTYTLFDFTSAATSSFDVTDFTFGTTLPGYTYALAFAGSTLELTATASAIPEPSTYGLLAGLGVLGLAAWRRCRSA